MLVFDLSFFDTNLLSPNKTQKNFFTIFDDIQELIRQLKSIDVDWNWLTNTDVFVNQFFEVFLKEQKYKLSRKKPKNA